MRERRLARQVHIFAVFAQMMRRILVDAARTRGGGKRGGAAVKVDLNESIDGMAERGAELVALDDALEALALDPRNAKGKLTSTACTL